jgi:tetratricopeptide (TPR) repeat protein
MDRVSNLRRTIGIAAILSALTLAVFWPVVHSDFIKFDDGYYVARNARVAQGLTPGNVVWAFTTGYQGNWNPLTWLSYMLDAQLFGLKPGWHHFTNLMLHVANTVLLFLLLLRLTAAFWRSAFAAALFAVHPLHVESVAWVSERKGVLSTLFFFLTLLAYAKYAGKAARRAAGETSTPNPANPPRHPAPARTWYFLSLVFFALGLMSKPTLVTVPFLLLLLDFWPFRRFDPANDFQLRNVVPLLKEKVPFLIFAIVSTILTLLAQSTIHGLTAHPLAARIANAVESCVRYLGKTIWPVNLAVYYPHPADPFRLSSQWPAWLIWTAALLLAAVSASALIASKRRPWLATGWFWYLVALAPVIGIIQVGAHGMADRYTYIPLIGIFICVAWSAAELCQGNKNFQIALTVVGLGIVAACALTSHRQVQYWRNNTILFQHTLAVTGNNPFAQYHVARGLREEGKTVEAMAELKSVIAADPSLGIAYCEIADMLESAGNTNEAIAQYEAALRMTPDVGWIHNHLGVLFMRMGQPDQAAAQYQEAVQKEPDNADAQYNLGIALFDRGDYTAAAFHLAAAARLQPKDADVRVSLAEAELKVDRSDQAQAALQEAVRICPTNAQAHESLGLILARQDHFHEAVPHFQAAVKLKPDWPDALNNLAWVEATQLGDGPEAVRLAQRACALTGGREARFLGTLDTAYAAAGRLEDAIRTAEKARDLALAAGQKDLADAAETRLASYRNRPTPQK